jgi:hypothetical protein
MAWAGHPLTRRPSLTYCECSTRMRNRSGVLSHARPWQRAVCLLLAVLLLYNPFLFLVHTGTGLRVQHPVSKRATVASSELKHFPPVSERTSLDALPTECAGEHCAPLKEAFQSVVDVDSDRLTVTELSANLWFRPPPIA